MFDQDVRNLVETISGTVATEEPTIDPQKCFNLLESEDDVY